MRFSRTHTVVALLLEFIAATSVAMAEERRQAVSARVTGGSGRGVGIQAEKVPGEFTVPEGHVATRFKYHFTDPASNYTSNRLGPANIYSETLGRDIREAEGNPNLRLPAGKYKFVVGGRPGAYGTLSFKIIPATSRPPSERSTVPISGTIDAQFTIPDTPAGPVSIQWTFYLNQGRVTGESRHPTPAQTNAPYNAVEAAEWVTKFTGTIQGNLITGSTTFILGPFDQWSLPGSTDKPWRRRHTYRGGHNGVRIALRADGSATFSHPDGRMEIHTVVLQGESWNGQRQFSTKSQAAAATLHGTWRHRNHAKADTPGQRIRGKNKNPNRGMTSDPPADRHDSNRPDEGVWTARTPADDPSVDEGSDTTSAATDNAAADRHDSDPPDNIWINEEPTDDRLDDDHIKDDPIEDWDDDRDPPRPGDRLGDGKILFKPPWDEGDAYPMDEEEVKEILKKQREGFRWDKRNGWVDDERQKDIDHIADIERRNDEKEKRRTRDIFKELADSRKRAQDHADKAKRAGDEAIAAKVKALGWNALTPDERDRLGKADDDIKDELRGKPESIRGYQRGFIDRTLPQGAIDATHRGLEITKTAIDEGMGFMESKGGTAGKAIGALYTVGSNIAEELSKTHANYHAGMTDKADYGGALGKGTKKGIVDVLVNEASSKVNDKVTDRVLDSQPARDAVEWTVGGEGPNAEVKEPQGANVSEESGDDVPTKRSEDDEADED